MNYGIEIYDVAGRRIARFDQVPLFEATRTIPGETDRAQGMLPAAVQRLGHAYRIRVIVEGRVFCEATVDRIEASWGDFQRLILDRYVTFHETVVVDAQQSTDEAGTIVAYSYRNRRVDAMVKDAINRALGRIHYSVAHGAYPEGAHREYSKLEWRKTPANELEVGGIDSGQWVGADRINAEAAYAKDGDTIAGLVVDGVPWPDVRLLLIDCEEKARNSHAVKRHPEVAEWTDAQYAASGYRLRADAATNALQTLIDSKGIAFIELNPHRDASGIYDDRIDAYGRYIGLVYGGGECFNAAMIELGHADVYLYEDGAFHVPEMELKDFFSYTGTHEDSVAEARVILGRFEAASGVFEVLTGLAYAAGGYVWSLDVEHGVRFRPAERPDHVVSFDPIRTAITLGSDSDPVANIVYLEGNPFLGAFEKRYRRVPSIDAYGVRARHLDYYAFSREDDADKVMAGMLDDVAYPTPCGAVVFFGGNAEIAPGDLIELRDVPLRRLDERVAGEWGGRFTGRLVGRAAAVTHRFAGRQVTTTVALTSPLRSVADPLRFAVRGQPTEHMMQQFRLDDGKVGLDAGYHLD
ncbi:MAG TPA: thermonuclease family protein [Candidatus Hydrogenedentes bacterium]|nr:thermonuclease family protein [Candidatus Hydrogenedentota bacterium]HPG67593.1 thermonuclease family protein [Candidatus Hydrogenedentota bacterium]